VYFQSCEFAFKFWLWISLFKINKLLFSCLIFFFPVDFQETNSLILGRRGMLAVALAFSCVSRTLSTIIFPLNTKWLSEGALLNCLFQLKTL